MRKWFQRRKVRNLTTTREVTPQEMAVLGEHMDAAFSKMDEAFAEMDKAFGAIGSEKKPT
jgi:hypothetical protein